MLKRKVRISKKALKKYHCSIDTPFDYSGDGKEEERQSAQHDRDAEARRPER